MLIFKNLAILFYTKIIRDYKIQQKHLYYYLKLNFKNLRKQFFFKILIDLLEYLRKKKIVIFYLIYNLK